MNKPIILKVHEEYKLYELEALCEPLNDDDIFIAGNRTYNKEEILSLIKDASTIDRLIDSEQTSLMVDNISFDKEGYATGGGLAGRGCLTFCNHERNVKCPKCGDLRKRCGICSGCIYKGTAKLFSIFK